MKNRNLGTDSKSSTRRRRAGASSTSLLAVLLLLVAGGGVVAWLVLGGGRPAPIAPKPAAPDNPKKTTELPKPEVAVETQGVESDDWNKQMEKAKDAPVKQSLFKNRTLETTTATLEGDVVDADTNEPVYYAWLYLIPPERGDVVEAAKGWTPNRFRNGHFSLQHQPTGVYNVLCESQEHDAWTGTIKVPYDGPFKIRLKRGTAVEGFVRDVNQMPIEGIDVQLVVDLTKIDGGANPPIQRIVRTNKLGHYAFNKLPPGSYGLQATLIGDVLATEPEFRVDPRATVTRDFNLPRLGTLKLSVKNIADQPISRARVSLIEKRDGRDRPVRTATSDIKGIARVEFIREGSYTLKVVVQGFETYEDQVTVAGGDESREVPVQLRVAAKSGN
jgi:carboxypeptidase family protein